MVSGLGLRVSGFWGFPAFGALRVYRADRVSGLGLRVI